MVPNDPTDRPQRGFLAPKSVDPSTERWTSPHYFAAPERVAPQGVLALVFPGTGGTPRDYRLLANQAAALGLHALVLRYPNETSINELAGQDPSAHLDLRLDVWDGAGRTGRQGIRPGEAILPRLTGALEWLSANRPGDGWSRYLGPDGVAWDRVAALGHSLGGGYAMLAARLHALDRAVAMGFADWCRATGERARWLSDPMATGVDRRFFFLHERDEMVPLGTGLAVASCLVPGGEPRRIESGDPPWDRGRILTTDLDPSDEWPVPSPCHNSLALDVRTPRWPDGGPVFADVWTWLCVGR